MLVTKAPDANNIGVNNLDTVFKNLVSKVLTGPKAAPISYVGDRRQISPHGLRSDTLD